MVPGPPALVRGVPRRQRRWIGEGDSDSKGQINASDLNENNSHSDDDEGNSVDTLLDENGIPVNSIEFQYIFIEFRNFHNKIGRLFVVIW